MYMGYLGQANSESRMVAARGLKGWGEWEDTV